MLERLAVRILPLLPPGLVPDASLHRRALAASAAGRYVDAEQWFEAAATAYRRSLNVEALARLRVHQAMTRARASQDPAHEAADMLEIVRALNRLDRLESFAAPHGLADAREVFARWLEGAPRGSADAVPGRARAAA